MPKSRGRKPRRSSKRRTARPRPTRGGWGALEPWARAMMLADEAEARGDALGALDVMEAFSVGPDGQDFGRLSRAHYLFQIALLGPILPPWVISRWICNQALQCLDESSRDRMRRAVAVTVEVCGASDRPSREDEAGTHMRIVDQDWAYRQLFLYELGGLEFFVRRIAGSELLAKSDSINEWSRAPMGGYELVHEGTATATWRDLASGEHQMIADIGSGVFVAPGEHVIGRLVPTDGGPMFESRPLIVPQRLASAVAESPPDWLDLLRASRPEPGEDPIITKGPDRDSLLSDVPAYTWQLALFGAADLGVEPGDEGFDSAVARALLDVGAREMDGAERVRDENEVNVWPCLGTALLEPYVVAGLRDALRPSDHRLLHQLSQLLAEPAASLCREVARERFDAA